MEKITEFLSSQWMIIEIVLASLLLVFIITLAIVAAVKNKQLKNYRANLDDSYASNGNSLLLLDQKNKELEESNKKFNSAVILHKNELEVTKKNYEDQLFEKDTKYKEEVERAATEKHSLEVHISDLEKSFDSLNTELDATKKKLSQEKEKTQKLEADLETVRDENELNISQNIKLQDQLKKALETPVIEHRLVLEKQLYTMKRDELLDIAREIKLSNYSKLRVDDLIKAIIKDQERLVK